MSMHYCQQGRRVPTVFVVECKGCHRYIPAAVEAQPKDHTVVQCSLCGEKRRYRPSEVFLGWPSSALEKQAVNRAAHFQSVRKKAG